MKSFYLIIIKLVAYAATVSTDSEADNVLKENITAKRIWLCPLNEHRDENLWELYDNATNKCYPPKTKGPCKSPYAFFDGNLGSDSEYGHCRCRDIPFRSLNLNRPVAISPVDEECYPLYEKAGCKDGEWLVLETNVTAPLPYESWTGVCKTNPCLPAESKNVPVNTTVLLKFLGYEYYITRDDFKCSDFETSPGGLHPLDLNKPFWFIYEGKCYETFTRGPCDIGQLIVFEGTDTIPKCYDPITKLSKNVNSERDGYEPNVLTPTIEGKTRLCPENQSIFAENQWQLYHNATNQCYMPWTKGPCNGTLKYWSQYFKGSEFGVCRNVSPLNTFKKLNRPIAKSSKDGEIYMIYSKANCNDGEWFVFDKDYTGICSKNPCLDNPESASTTEVNTTELIKYLGYEFYDSYDNFTKDDIAAFPQGHPLEIHKPFWFLHKGKCYKYFSRGPCDEREFFVFKGTNPIPTCYNPKVVYEIGLPAVLPAFSQTLTPAQKCAGITSGDSCVPLGTEFP